jgi:hypothetical protein
MQELQDTIDIGFHCGLVEVQSFSIPNFELKRATTNIIKNKNSE